MDTLKTLMDKREYDLIIKITEKAVDAESLFYRISALLGVGQGQNALDCLKAHHQELHKNLYLLIKVHIELLLILGKFDEAYEELEYYKNLPYESQRVEELLSSMVGHIREEERRQFQKPGLTDEEIKSRLISNDKTAVMSALDLAGSRGVEPFLKEIQYVMVNNPIQSIRSIALMVLVQKNINKDFQFKSKEGLITVYPSNTKPPFTNDKFTNICKRMGAEFKNPSISNNAIEIFSAYIIDVYPEEIDEDDDVIIAALYLISCDCLQIKDIPTFDEYCAMHKLEEVTVYQMYNKFAEIIKNF